MFGWLKTAGTQLLRRLNNPRGPATPAVGRRRWFALLQPGLDLKRWILLLVVGVTATGLGLDLLVREFIQPLAFPAFAELLALRAMPAWLQVLLLLSAGLGAVATGVWQLNRVVVTALAPENQERSNRELLDAVVQSRQRRLGPKVVAIGGGTGMPTLLRGLGQYTDHITAIVTVADDGGSSGRLRRQMGMLPPGDFRNNIAALSEAEELMTRLLQYRFGDADFGGDGLGGHSFGNLFITAMAAVTGSFESGIAESSRVLAVKGQILPSTLEQVMLCAEVHRRQPDGSEAWSFIRGESQIPGSGGRIARVHLEPANARAYPDAIRAILNADLIVAGPGSFFTSVLPNLLVPAIRQAICASRAHRVFICNVATQRGETDHFDVNDHMAQLRLHAGQAFTTVLANHRFDEHTPPAPDVQWVTLPTDTAALDYRLFTGDLVDDRRSWRHDPAKLASRLLEVYEILQVERLEEGSRFLSAPSVSAESSPGS